jgi:hypothetical protein
MKHVFLEMKDSKVAKSVLLTLPCFENAKSQT